MKRRIVLVDDDAQFCDAFREYLAYRDYDCLVYHDSRSAFNGILWKKGTIWGIVVDLELVGSPEQGVSCCDRTGESRHAERAFRQPVSEGRR